MEEVIRIIEKPGWVSWEEIHDVIWESHETNRKRGMNMSHAALSGEEIEAHLASGGKMFVAVLGRKVIGTAAYQVKNVRFWFGGGSFAYCCFAAILPEFRGRGVYGELMKERENAAISRGLDKMMFNTHPNNTRVIEVALKNGYRKVSYTFGDDNPWVYLVKWLNGAPCPDWLLDAMFGCIKTARMAECRLRRLFKR